MDYYFGGLRLSSCVALDQLRLNRAGRRAATVEISLSVESGPAPSATAIVYRWPGRYGLTLGVCSQGWLMASAMDGVFLISEADRAIRCFVEHPAHGAWLDVLVRRVLPRMATLFGATAIHAAAVADAGGGLLLLGPSGAGKSTLSAALGNRGWQVLSDDISILWSDGAPVMTPAAPGVCVWPDSRDALALPSEQCRPMPGYDGKLRFTPSGDADADAVPVKALVFLSRSDGDAAPVLRELPAGVGLIEASRQLVRFNPGDRSRGTAGAFERLASIVRDTRCYRMEYAADYAALPQVAAALRQLLGA